MEEKKRNFLLSNGVKVDVGIENTLDFETYNELLIEFCDNLVEEVNKFNNFKLSMDMVNYEIIVHALKSNCRTLGFMELGELFYQHELASKQGDIEYVKAHYDELIKEVNRVYGILMTYKGME